MWTQKLVKYRTLLHLLHINKNPYYHNENSIKTLYIIIKTHIMTIKTALKPYRRGSLLQALKQVHDLRLFLYILHFLREIEIILNSSKIIYWIDKYMEHYYWYYYHYWCFYYYCCYYYQTCTIPIYNNVKHTTKYYYTTIIHTYTTTILQQLPLPPPTWITSKFAAPALPTFTTSGFTRVLFAKSVNFWGIVAENRIVCLARLNLSIMLWT